MDKEVGSVSRTFTETRLRYAEDDTTREVYEALFYTQCIPLYLTGNHPTTATPFQGWLQGVPHPFAVSKSSALLGQWPVPQQRLAIRC
jgi:hypothetical protein